MKKIGLYIEYFDPPHKIHIENAHQLLGEEELEEIIFIPAGNNNFQHSARHITKPAYRLEMCLKELNKETKLSLSDIGIQKDSPMHWIDVLDEFYMVYPARYTLIVNGNDINNIATPRSSQKRDVLDKLIICTHSLKTDEMFLNKLPEWLVNKARIFRIDTKLPSSEDIKDKCKKKLPISGLMKQDTERYIIEKKLYLD